mgnify:CR=1 FL=1
MADETKELVCSFCNRPQSMVRRLLIGDGVCICDECVTEFCHIIDDEEALAAIKEEKTLDLVTDIPTPAEIAATLSAAKKVEHNRIITVFQPHTYTRTKAFLDDFAKALSASDIVVLADIYAAREKNTIGISSLDLKEKIDKLGTECHYFGSFEEIEKFLLKNCVNDDLLITMGAGNVVEIGETLLGK